MPVRKLIPPFTPTARPGTSSPHALNVNFQLYSNLEVQQKIHWDWPAVCEAIRGRPGYIIYYKLDKYKEIRR